MTKLSERNSHKPEVFAGVVNGYWECPACAGRSRDIYNVCSDCGQSVRHTEQPEKRKISLEELYPEIYRPINQAANWAIGLGFLGIIMALVMIGAKFSGNPIMEDFGSLDAAFNIFTGFFSIYWGSKVKIVNRKQVRCFTWLIILYAIKLFYLFAGIVYSGPQPVRFVVIIWILIVLRKGRKAAQKFRTKIDEPQSQKVKSWDELL